MFLLYKGMVGAGLGLTSCERVGVRGARLGLTSLSCCVMEALHPSRVLAKRTKVASLPANGGVVVFPS